MAVSQKKHNAEAKKLFSKLNRMIENFKKYKGEDLIPHQVLAHGFSEWHTIIFRQFPILGWRDGETEAKQGFKFEYFMRFFYDRFFLLIAELPALAGMSEEEKEQLKEEGWKEFLED